MKKTAGNVSTTRDKGVMPGAVKAAYSSPMLVKYGSVASITGSGGTCSTFDCRNSNIGGKADGRTGACVQMVCR